MQKIAAGVTLKVLAYNRDRTQQLATGKLLTVDNQIDPTTGTSKLKAVFDNTNDVLFPNQFVNTRLLLETKHDQVIIPTVKPCGLRNAGIFVKRSHAGHGRDREHNHGGHYRGIGHVH